ncbi:hypothetical protein LF1_17580 [Rubripirellula obstinata]|uniref:Fe-S protein n=1 Tax=Rubripirellula obstinata TaxID=406547 RepID=A0A5B1CHP4_9BACT|nr:hypothetical protein LF1_17580 [Rubripirellula obstinata]
MSDPRNEPESPCINVCVIDGSKMCVGCYRNLDEIAAWGSCSDQQKLTILDAARKRRETSE